MKRFLSRFSLKPVLFFLAAAILIEIFGFNFRALESLTFPAAQKVETDSYLVPSADGVTFEPTPEAVAAVAEDGTYAVLFPEGTTLGSDGSIAWPADVVPQIGILSNGNLQAENLLLEAAKIEDKEVYYNPEIFQRRVNALIYATDEGNAYAYELPSVTLYSKEPASNYIRLNLSGHMRFLRVTFPDLGTDQLTIGDISLNVRRPFFINILRLGLMFILFACAYGLRPSSVVWQSAYSLKKNAHLAVVILVVFTQLVTTVWMVSAFKKGYALDIPHHRQYYHLAIALSEGHFYLDDEPSEALKAMDNPYDLTARTQQGVDYIWDTAYYNGKYYCYFGILPVLVFYLPTLIVTGTEFPAHFGIMICLAVAALLLIALLDEIVDQFFPETSLGEFLLLDMGLFAASGILIGAQQPTFYQLPVSMALMLTLLGLFFWVSARRRFSTKSIVAGAVCMALTAACRPQFVLASFLVFPLLGGEAKRRIFSPSEKGARARTVRTVLLALIPYVVVAAFLMYYNFARFGSPFDFGANYNLTTNDMTHRGFHLDRLPFGYFTNLFQPPVLTGKRPFLQYVTILTHYQGFTVFEGMFGGILWFAPVLFGVFLLPMKKYRRRLAEKGLLAFSFLCLFLGLFLIGFDVEEAGILQRYWIDFGYLLAIPAVIALLERGQSCREADDISLADGRQLCREADKDGAVTASALAVHARLLLWMTAATFAIWGLWLYMCC